MTTIMKQLTRKAAALAVAALLVVPIALQAQSAEELVETAIERQTEHMQEAGVETYTVVTETMGFTSTTYYEKTEVDGETLYMAQKTSGSKAADKAPNNPYAHLYEIAERATVKGTEAVNGEDCYVLFADDLKGTELAESMSSGGQVQAEQGTVWLDSDEYLVRRMDVEGTVTRKGQSTDATLTAYMQDYRDVKGVIHPFRTKVSVEGLGGQMPEASRQKARESLEKIREEMENMTPAQRKAMKQMMTGQLKKLEQMLTSGAMDFTVQVKEIRVNQEPPQ